MAKRRKRTRINPSLVWVLAGLCSAMIYGLLTWLFSMTIQNTVAKTQEEDTPVLEVIESLPNPETSDFVQGESDVETPKHLQGETEWSYSGSIGPQHWGELDEEFFRCSKGKRQSPIDIDKFQETAKLLPLKFRYTSTELSFIHTGHRLYSRVANGQYIEIDGEKYDLMQLHFHVPGEHKIKGGTYDLELQLVHENSEGKVAIVALLFDEGDSHTFMTKLTNFFPDRPHEQGKTFVIDLTNILPKYRKFYNYTGSMTTPPCEEGVNWFVMARHQQTTSSSVDNVVTILKHNARPIQKLNSRKVYKSLR